MTVRPTHHAALRWLQRVDPREPQPSQRVREAFARARREDRDDVEGEAWVDDEDDVVLVVHSGTICTIWPDTDTDTEDTGR